MQSDAKPGWIGTLKTQDIDHVGLPEAQAGGFENWGIFAFFLSVIVL